ncbi:MAG: cytochrome-c peroxidase [Gammaproteobacteria bacterium]
MTRQVAFLGAVLLAAFALAGDIPPPPLGLDSFLPTPEDNPLSIEKIALGRKLFHDTRLSRDGTLSCASCHNPDHGFTDAKPLAVGVFGRKGGRRVPAIVNRGYGRSFFWDGRVPTLEQQVLEPITNPQEMDLTLEEAAARVGLEQAALSRALASYVRTIRAGDSPYDRYVAGDRAALGEKERDGLKVFRGKGNCVVCHVGANLTDEKFHNTGVAWDGQGFPDPGRHNVTGKESDRGAFKTPTLREVARRPPFMHNGSLATLEEVVDFYDKGGKQNPHLDPDIRPLGLSAAEKAALIAFLRALSGTVQR